MTTTIIPQTPTDKARLAFIERAVRVEKLAPAPQLKALIQAARDLKGRPAVAWFKLEYELNCFQRVRSRDHHETAPRFDAIAIALGADVRWDEPEFKCATCCDTGERCNECCQPEGMGDCGRCMTVPCRDCKGVGRG